MKNNRSMPELLGSEKQVAWAMRLRQNYVNYLRSRLYDWDEAKIEEFIAWLVDTKITASWWIDELGHDFNGACDDVTLEAIQDWKDGEVNPNFVRPEQTEKLYEEVTMPYNQYKAGYRHCYAVPGSYDAATKTIVVQIPV